MSRARNTVASLREDFISALRADIVRTLVQEAVGSERAAMRVASEILGAVQRRYGGEEVYVPRRMVDEQQILAEWRGDNRDEICRKHRISRSAFYRLLARAPAPSPHTPAEVPVRE